MWASGWFATVLSAYYIVRPVRDAFGSIEGSRQLPWLFTAVFVTMLVAVPVYSQLVAMFSRRKLVPVVYRFLALNLVAFSVAMRWLDEESLKYVARIFFVWVAVYVLFATSLFWSVQADTFSQERGKRLFGAISGFGTVGGIAGSLLVGISAKLLGPENLLLLSAALMEAGLYCYRRLEVATAGDSHIGTTADQRSRNPLAGFLQVVRSSYLRRIMFYVLTTTMCGTWLYIVQADMLKAAYPDNAERTAVFADLNFATQVMTVILQFVITVRLMKLSLTLTLCVLPLIYTAGSAGLMAWPELPVLMFAIVASRACTYGVAVPALGVLYTVVSHDEKYKAKSIIDTLVIRGGDVTANWSITMLRSMGAAATMISGMTLCLSFIGTVIAMLLGREAHARQSSDGVSH